MSQRSPGGQLLATQQAPSVQERPSAHGDGVAASHGVPAPGPNVGVGVGVGGWLQVPSCPGTLQISFTSQRSVAQQMLSTQKVDAH